MHELGITKGILDIALRTAAERKATKVRGIRLKIGAWSSIDPECINFYFEAIASGTPAEGADIHVETIPLTAKCTACGSPFEPEDLVFRCPGCGSADVEIASGREMYVESVEVEIDGN